jgi:hypothetical protein
VHGQVTPESTVEVFDRHRGTGRHAGGLPDGVDVAGAYQRGGGAGDGGPTGCGARGTAAASRLIACACGPRRSYSGAAR